MGVMLSNTCGWQYLGIYIHESIVLAKNTNLPVSGFKMRQKEEKTKRKMQK